MANAFDFELKADEQVSAAIQRIEDAVKSLDPMLEKTTGNLKLGGQDSLDGLESLSDRLAKMSTFARDNVQFIGDMVPPLKMVGELGGKLGGALRFGAAGVAAAGVGAGVSYLA
ncbi:MAG: lytic transglycosylase domain-containing protein, partial [Chania sp.]